MIKFWKKMFSNTDKVSTAVFIILRIVVIICLILEIINGNMRNVLDCVIAYILLILPIALEKIFKINIPVAFEICIYTFIFMAEMLGGVYDFYDLFPWWDIALHTFWGFLCAAFGFSLAYLLNKSKKMTLAPFFLALSGFCFSMTSGVIWEFYEYGADHILGIDSQRDEYVNNINSLLLWPKKINNISYTVVYDKDDKELAKFDKYIDIGLNDTMSDMLVNFAGAITFCVMGYLYARNEKRYKFVGLFVTKKE